MTASAPLDAKTTETWQGGSTFSIYNRLYRLAFGIVWGLLAAWTPPPLMGWRRWLLRRFGAKLASTAKVYGSARIWWPGNLVMEEHSAIGPRTIIYAMAPIKIGAYAVVSQGAHLCAGTHDIEDPHFQLCVRPIEVQQRAWVAAEAFVGPGVTVGEGAVLGARACAMRNLQPWTVYSGNPAVPVKPRALRFDDAPAANPVFSQLSR
ncbi:putative colanic acid biosynthesis acetyltransferase [Novosphingobium resinovorum]|uniref:putative colanic acid biosynthesis acetyltransferase n=1 Tax=Novosphingobium TaxID=165696 RepID=UPI001B3C50EF|nr:MULTISPECIES: putative colanic acid biosynthesis acetyltransferase [Novosphingobium]MBF7012797.1 putative colanic acid biosynthesis acetyltransferase [Novosphingobium sp. HR1a]WJM27534.1 putative colanic acid biosynthesis acetyltransferase [Novosphingobium resinovorum]